MRKLLSGIILFLVLSGIPGGTVVRSEPLPDKSSMPLALGSTSQTVNAVFSHTVESFALYSSFLEDYTLNNDYLVPLHGSSQQQAQNYLNSGFTADMAKAIVDECTVYNSKLGCLVINPGDGIPVLTNRDRNEILLYSENENKIVFLRKYNNCYAEGDEYQFLITMTRDDNSWKISDLSFTAASKYP